MRITPELETSMYARPTLMGPLYVGYKLSVESTQACPTCFYIDPIFSYYGMRLHILVVLSLKSGRQVKERKNNGRGSGLGLYLPDNGPTMISGVGMAPTYGRSTISQALARLKPAL
jgi:hypothetical protein